jgi:hypothetical protein
MVGVDVETILKQVEALLAGAGELPGEVEQAVGMLLNVVKSLNADRRELTKEVERLRQQVEQKKRSKTTGEGKQDDGPKTNRNSDHSSEKHRRDREQKTRPIPDRRSFKDLPIHEVIECPVDPATLPPDAVRMPDESVVVQDIEIKPRNLRFQRQVYYSAAAAKFFRGPLPSGYEAGDFGVNLRALILSLKYCGNMSEPKIREFLENFTVQVSAGSLSTILTNTAAAFEPEYHAVLVAGLSSTPYQQTDDPSACVAGQSWHTHILCNPFYTWYSTRPGKDRLSVLAMLQNQPQPRFRFNPQTLALLRDEFTIPDKWQQSLATWLAQRGGDVEDDAPSLKSLLDDWFGGSCRQLRTAIEQAAAIGAYRGQTAVPVIQVLVCDDAGQFKLLTDHLALCWIHAGRHYERLSPVVPGHARALDDFAKRFWDFYAGLQDYRAGPSEAWAAKLRAEFDTLFATRTGYDALDDRIAKTAAKKEALLTVLSHPAVPLHNNASELGARVSARRRDVSLHSRSSRGARAMDIFTTLVQTCKKLSLSAYAYFHAHLRKTLPLPSLANHIHQAAAGG